MITANAIEFSHSRIANKMEGTQYTSGIEEFGKLPLYFPHSITVDKQTVKIYYPYSTQKAIYYPTGMQGPVVKMKGSTPDINSWRAVFANDILTVDSFDYPTWNVTLYPDSEWWVDIKSADTGPGWLHNGEIRFTLSIDLYFRGII